MIGVYQITCVTTGDSYIGSTLDIGTRWQQHKYDLCRQKHSNKKLQSIFDKNGLFSFALNVLHETGPIVRIELLALELSYIKDLNPSLNHESEVMKIEKMIAATVRRSNYAQMFNDGRRV